MLTWKDYFWHWLRFWCGMKVKDYSGNVMVEINCRVCMKKFVTPEAWERHNNHSDDPFVGNLFQDKDEKERLEALRILDQLRRIMTTFADDLPELYPPGTANDLDNEIKAALDSINKVIREHPEAKPDEQHRLIQEWCKANRYSVTWAKPDEPMQVYIASSVAPELDTWIDVSWPGPRTLDSEWSV